MNKRTGIVGILCIMLVFALIGCGSGPSPDTVVGNYLTAIQQGDLVAASQYLEPTEDSITNSETEDDEDLEMQKALFSKIQYEIISSNVEENTAKVKTKITSLDLVKITSNVMAEVMPLAFASAFSENSNDEEMEKLSEQYFNNAILDPDAPTTTNTVTIKLNKKDGTWLIAPDDELLNGLTGNLGTLANLFGEPENGTGE